MNEYRVKTNKRRCIPCGYIYDPDIWDIDSGIKPWTLFEDIPEDRRCPICLVTKKDFIQIEEIDKNFKSTIINLVFLTNDIIEIKLEIFQNIKYIFWQFLH
jgi:rubredoxin